MSSSSIEECQIDLNEDFSNDIEIYHQIMHLKEDLLPNNIYGPIFYKYYNYMEDKDNNSKETIFEKNLSKENNRLLQDLEEREQIDEVKINLYLILKKKCKYNGKYEKIIFGKFFEIKRLIIQKYEIRGKEIEFGPKEYCFIPKENFIIRYKGKKIEFGKNKMKIDEKEILNEKNFQKIHNLSNLDKEEKEYNQAKKLRKKSKNNFSDINAENDKIKKYSGLSIGALSNRNDNNSLSQFPINIDIDLNLNFSKISETSDNEIIGNKFFDEKNRYIYNFYRKEIDGVYTSHSDIILNTKNKVDLINSLDSLEETYKETNDIFSNIIFKNFDSEVIRDAFLLEVKTSMAELDKLLFQAKEMSKIVKNISEIELPNYVIGIICSFNSEQIRTQKNILKKKYREKSNETFIEHMIKIINENGLNVLFTIIKDEIISGYPLGTNDFQIVGENLTKRIDINYFNKKVCNGEYTPEELEQISKDYPYESLIFDITNTYYSFEKYKKLEKENNRLKDENKSQAKKIKELEEELKKYKKEQ